MNKLAQIKEAVEKLSVLKRSPLGPIESVFSGKHLGEQQSVFSKKGLASLQPPKKSNNVIQTSSTTFTKKPAVARA